MPGHIKSPSTLRRIVAILLTFALMNAVAIQQALALSPGHVT